MPVGCRRECPCSLGAAAVPDLGITFLFIFFWVRSLNSGDLEYLQVMGPVSSFYAIQKKEIVHVVGTRWYNEVIAGSELVKHVLTYSDAEAANLDEAHIAIFGVSHSQLV
jgi:hypothetical protein